MSVRGSTHKIKVPTVVTFSVIKGRDSELALQVGDTVYDGLAVPRTPEGKKMALECLKTGQDMPIEWFKDF